MKKLFALTFVFVLVGCGNGEENSSQEISEKNPNQEKTHQLEEETSVGNEETSESNSDITDEESDSNGNDTTIESNNVTDNTETSNNTTNEVKSPSSEAKSTSPDLSALANDDSVIGTLAKDGRFTAFLQFLQEAGLIEALQKSDALTVFAPTDSAFQPFLEDAEIRELIFSDQVLLPSILMTHITSGELTIEKIIDLVGIETLSGVELSITQAEDSSIVLAQSAKIVEADLKGKNGVIQVLDRVIIPALPDSE